MSEDSLGIIGVESIHYYVRDLERSRRFYTEAMDFSEVGGSSEELEDSGKQRSLIFAAGHVTVVCSQPLGESGRAARFLSRHPDGVGSITFLVRDVDRVFSMLEERGGTPTSAVQRFNDGNGEIAFFSICTPFGDTLFRFAERRGFAALFPGMVMHTEPKGGRNIFGFNQIDHITSNFNTLKPALLWLEHVLGFEPFWGVEFHTTDVAPAAVEGSGLRSIVMWDPASRVRFANNEPWRPFFRQSQIFLFNEDNRGDGVQHIAVTVPDIIGAVRGLRGRGVEFMPTPAAYYDALPERIARMGIERIDEDIDELRELEILVDGEARGRYLLQIFLKESAGLYNDPEAGPFFYEIIQRKGDEGFGAGNFRALFESIERQQRSDGKA